VGIGADIDDLRTHPLEQQVGQRERAKEVRAHRHLEAIDGVTTLLRDHARVIDQDVHVAGEQIGKRPH
jgi:hypothetical protein